MLKKIALGVLALAAVVSGVAAFKPADYVIYRFVAIQAPPAKIFEWLNSAAGTQLWMPWSEIDPAVQMTFSGPKTGVGSKASWISSGKMGTGSSTISKSVPNKSVLFDLEYVKPFAMRQTAEISIIPSGSLSVVRWSVSGRNAFAGRLMSLFVDMDKMVGGSFEKGLSKLKKLAEA